MSINFKWIKFTNYGGELLKGILYLNPLEHYRGIESIIDKKFDNQRNNAVNDFLEGSIASVNPTELSSFGLEFDDNIKDALIGNVHFLSEDLKYLKVFCVYTLLFDSEEKTVILPSKKIREFGYSHGVVINDTNEFIRRIVDCLTKNNGYDRITAFKGEFVKYYHDDERTKFLGVFNKKDEFEWEHEFRFIFPERVPTLEPLVLNIGDISDIASKHTVDELIDSPCSLFPGYSFIYEDK